MNGMIWIGIFFISLSVLITVLLAPGVNLLTIIGIVMFTLGLHLKYHHGE